MLKAKQLRVITPDGEVTITPLPKATMAQYEIISKAVGGPIERIPYTANSWVNEEGCLINLPRNVVGRNEAHKLIIEKYRGVMDSEYSAYHGNVAIVEFAP